MSNLITKLWSAVFSRFKYRSRDALFALGQGKGLLKNRPGSRILIYHGVTPQGPLSTNHRFISTDLFEAHLQYFKTHFHVVSLHDLCNGERHPEKLTLALTFDDGYANNLHHALPLLEKHGLHATFFVTGIRDVGRDVLWADSLDLQTLLHDAPIEVRGETFRKVRGEYRHSNGKRLKELAKSHDHEYHRSIEAAFPPRADFKKREELCDYWTQMTLKELQQLDRSPVATVGLHGYLHTNLAEIPFEHAMEELKAGKLFLERLLDRKVDQLAYPDGSYNIQLAESADELGFHYQFLVDALAPDHLSGRRWERMGIHPYLSVNNQMACLLEGHY